MSEKTKDEMQQFGSVSPTEASRSVIEGLDEECLEDVTGGVFGQGYTPPPIDWTKKDSGSEPSSPKSPKSPQGDKSETPKAFTTASGKTIGYTTPFGEGANKFLPNLEGTWKRW